MSRTASRQLGTPLLTLLASMLISGTTFMNAQQTSERTISRPAAPAATVKSSPKPKELSDAARAKAEQQRELALSLLVSLSNEAKDFRDQKLRARTLGRIADGLWEADKDQSRALFIKAWLSLIHI